MYVLIFSFLSALILSALIIRYNSVHHRFSGDSDLSGPQKFHHQSVPRIGGIALFIALLVASAIRTFQDLESGLFLSGIVMCAAPAFLIGFAEDITKRAGITLRLLGVGLSSFLLGYLFDAWLGSLHLWGIDYLLTFQYFSIALTIIALTGLANAFNIIDGFNGLASMVGIIALLAIAYVCFRVGDLSLLIAALAMIGAIGGFFLWNYPRGFIFLGDGGAYLIGFWIGALSVLLVARNPSVSPWFALLINAYPIFETLFSIWRRKVHQGKNPGMSDGAHFHSLIYRRIMKWITHDHTDPEIQNHHAGNARTSPYLWLLSSLAVFPAILFWEYTWVLQIFALLFCVSYVWIYRSIVQFKTPRWLKSRP
jgi:UDP-N-acetylmuramyl pentapeptide phosphotransferase/UDP-N-acetylglucosamine-1-phosphate transferase